MTSTRSSTSPSRAGLLVVWTLGLSLLVARPLCAASVSADTAVAPSSASLPGGQVLDRALTGDVSSGSKNADLLLEMRRNEGSDLGRSSRAPSDRSVVQPRAVPSGVTPSASATTIAPEVVPATLPGLVKRGLADADEALGLPKGATAQTIREWGGGGGGSVERATGSAGGVPAPATAAPGVHGVPGDASQVVLVPPQIIQALRDYRYWLLGVIALGFALGAAYKKFNRRI